MSASYYAVITMPQNAPVCSGPSTSTYVNNIGTIYAGDTVYVDWKEGDWYYVEYPIGSGRWKCGYAHKSYFGNTVNSASVGNIPSSNAGTRYVNTSDVTLYGYGSDYATAGSLSRGETVKYLGVKKEGYAFVEYDVTGTSKKKRAFFWANHLSTSPVS